MLRSLILACAIAVIATPADAQLGALRKKAEKAVANKVAPSTSARPTPVFDENVVELTEARVTQLLAGFAAEARVAAKNREWEAGREQRDAAYQQQLAQHERAYKEWEKKTAAWERCTQKYEDELDAAGREGQEFAKSVDTIALKGVAARIQAAQVRGDMAEVRRLVDSLSGAASAATPKNQRARDIDKRAEAECGRKPEEPKRPEAPADQRNNTVDDGAKASGMAENQYQIARERVLAWLSLGDDKITRGETKYAFTDGELAALGARKGELRQYESVLGEY